LGRRINKKLLKIVRAQRPPYVRAIVLPEVNHRGDGAKRQHASLGTSTSLATMETAA
jgi:hypothetical protein